MIFLCCNCPQITITNDSGVDYTTLAIAIGTIIITVYVVFLGKKVEISITKFNKLCLDPLEEKFNSLANYIDLNKNDIIINHLNQISQANTNLNLIFVQIKKVYPLLDIDSLQNISQEFTDEAFNNGDQELHTIFSDFLNMKIKILDGIYNYALYRELKFLSFHWWRKKTR